MKTSLLFVALTILSSWTVSMSPAVAGTVSTGGGVLYEQEANPWFLQNTATVSYCLAIDTEHLHLDPLVIRRRVKHALAVWTTELMTATDRYLLEGEPGLEWFGSVLLGTQEFIEEPCRETTQLHFQFGLLDAQQLQAVGDPRHYVATSVRTDYDPVTLRGRGFIYVAPDSGPLRPTASEFAASPWSVCDGCLLERAVLHELGHVFGLAHSGEDGDLMGTRHLESITRQSFIDRRIDARQDSVAVAKRCTSVDLFSFPRADEREGCNGSLVGEDFYKAFHLSDKLHCIKLVVARDGRSALEVYAAFDKNAPFQLMGAAATAKSTLSYSSGTISVQLNPRQKVFPERRDSTSLGMREPAQTTLGGPRPIIREELSLVYQSADQKFQTPLLLQLEPNRRWNVVTMVDGKLQNLAIDQD